LRQAREDAPAGGGQDGRTARDEDEANRQTFGDVVDRDRKGDENAQRRAASVGNADADPSLKE
jgi:hypothetical protein